MAAAWCVDDDDLAWLIGEIQECVRDLRRKIGEATFVAIEQGLANPNFEPSLDHMNRLLLAVVDMQGWTTMRRDSDHKIIEGSVRVITCHLEDEIPAGTRLEGQAFTRSPNNVLLRNHPGDLLACLVSGLYGIPL